MDEDAEFQNVLDAARRAEAWAFTELFERVAGRLTGFLAARGATDPEGLANEVLLRAFRAIGGFEGNEIQFRAWIFTIGRNLLVDERRKRERRPELRSIAPEEMPEPAGAGTDADLTAGMGDEWVRGVLDELPSSQREVLLLRIVAELPIKETAEIVGKTEGAVKLLQHRALRRLRKRLGTRGVIEP